MASTTKDIISVYMCSEDECIQKFRRIGFLDNTKLLCACDIKQTSFNDFKSKLEKGYIFIINCEHIHNFVTFYTTNLSEDSLSAVIVGNWHYESVRGIQHSISLLNAEGEQQFRKIMEDIQTGRGKQSPHTKYPLEENTKESVDESYLRVPDDPDFTETGVVATDEDTVPKEPILYSSKNEYSRMPGIGVVRGNNINGEVVTQNELVTESRFVMADTMLPPDSDSGPGVYVWEQACIPGGRNRITSADPETILAKLYQDDGDGSFEKQILGQFLPQFGLQWGITNLSRLLSCDSVKIRYSVIEIIEHICYRHNPSRTNTDDFIVAAEGTIASIIRHIGDETCVAQLSYILLLIFSMIYLQTITRKNLSSDILGENLDKFYRQLSELNPKQHISIIYFIEFIQQFIQCLVTNVRNLNKGHWLQMENWDDILATSSTKAEYIRKMVPKFNPCDRISVMVLLLNVIHRLDDTELPSQLLFDLVKEALRPTLGIRMKSRRSRSKQHAIALLISRGCRHILEKKSLIEAQVNERLREKIRDILLIALDTKDHTKHMVSQELKYLAFCKTIDIQRLVTERIVSEGQFANVYFQNICHKLKRTKVSLHCNIISRDKPEWATCPGNLGSMRIKAVCFFGNEDGNNSNSSRTYMNSSHENTDYDTDEVCKNMSTLVSLQKMDVHSNIVQLIAYQWKADPMFFVVEEPKGVKLQEYLLLKRKHRDWLSNLKLIFIVKQALCALQHLHDRYILHRDLTSNRFKICPETMTLKLVDFRLAKETNKQDVIVCLNDETQLAVRWTATESQVSDEFSFRSDIYMFGHFMFETWTHGCWPFSEHHDKTTDSIMEMVVRGGLKPKQPRCIPKDVFKAMLLTWESEDQRTSTKQLMKDLNTLLEQYSERKGTRPKTMQLTDDQYLRISKEQLLRNHEPEYGVQRTVLSIKVTKQKNYYNDELYKGRTGIAIQDTDLVSDNEAHLLEDTQGICTVSEALLMTQTDLRRQELETLSGTIRLEVKYDNDKHKELVFQYPKGRKLRAFAMAQTDVMSLLMVVLNTAKMIAKFHNAGWILRSICAFDLWISEEDKKVFPLRLSRCCAFPPCEEWVMDNVFKDRQNWLPIETLRDNEYTREGDVYQFAMTVVEVFNILDLSGPEKHSLSSIPFASINKKEELETALLRGELPKRPNSCPDALFAVLERCMSRERISRPHIHDVLSYIHNCIQSHKEKRTVGIKRQRMSTPKIDGTDNNYVNRNINSIYKGQVATQRCSEKFEQAVGSVCINAQNDILNEDESNYTKVPLSQTKNIPIKSRSISDSSIFESEAYSYANRGTLPHGNILDARPQAKIPLYEGCDRVRQRRVSLPYPTRDRERHTDNDAGPKTIQLEINRSKDLAFQTNKMSKKTSNSEKSDYSNGPASEGMDDISEENEISINGDKINWSKTQNVCVNVTDEMYDDPIVDVSIGERDTYSYAEKETLPNSNNFSSSNQTRIPKPDGCDSILQRKTLLTDQKRDLERYSDIEARRKTFHLDMSETKQHGDQIHTTPKKASRVSMFSKLKLGLTRRFRSSKTQSAKYNGDTEQNNCGESTFISDGTRSSSSGSSITFCNDSTSGTSTTSVEKENAEEAVYDVIPEYDDVLIRYSSSGDMTCESDTSDGEEQTTSHLKEDQDSLRIKQSHDISTASIVTENDSPLQSGSMDFHTSCLDEARHQTIAFENDEIYESPPISFDNRAFEE